MYELHWNGRICQQQLFVKMWTWRITCCICLQLGWSTSHEVWNFGCYDSEAEVREPGTADDDDDGYILEQEGEINFNIGNNIVCYWHVYKIPRIITYWLYRSIVQGYRRFQFNYFDYLTFGSMPSKCVEFFTNMMMNSSLCSVSVRCRVNLVRSCVEMRGAVVCGNCSLELSESLCSHV